MLLLIHALISTLHFSWAAIEIMVWMSNYIHQNDMN